MDLTQSTNSFSGGESNKPQSSSDNVQIKMPNYVVQLSTDKQDGAIRKIQPNAPRQGSANIPVGKATIFTSERPSSTSSRNSLSKGRYDHL